MFAKALLVWIAGLFTVVPGAVYWLFFHATRDQYAFLIVFPFFWVFGYWGVVGPLLSAVQVRRIMRALENARSKDDVLAVLRDPDAKEAAIEAIASDNGIPRFVAAFLYRTIAKRLAAAPAAAREDSPGGDGP